MRKTKKHIILIAMTALLALSIPVKAQIFLLEDEHEHSQRVNHTEFNVPIPYQGDDSDQYLYVPLGSGWLLLAGLGSAYLMGKKRKKED